MKKLRTGALATRLEIAEGRVTGLSYLRNGATHTVEVSREVVLSAGATQERIEHAVAAGAAGYLAKPIDLAALLSAVDEILAKADTRWG